MSGRLFAADIRTVYERLELPVFVGHGTKGDFQDFSETGWTEERPNWRLKAYGTGALVHWEEPDLFASDVERFLVAASAVGGRGAGPERRASA